MVIPLIFFVTLANTSMAQISGAVYRDFNEDGVRSYTATALGEIGVGGVTVNVYNSAGLAGTTTTSSATANVGSYTVSVSGSGPFRVEFVNLPSGYYNGIRGSASGTSVQFVASSPASNINLGINYPSDYCQADPNFIVPCYVNGNPTGGGTSGTQGVLVTLPYSATSSLVGSSTGGNAPNETAIGINSQIGTVFGVAYQRATNYVFTAAFVKRHSGLGPNGAGAIYISKPSGTTYTHGLFVSLPTAATAVTLSGTSVVGSNSTRGLPTSLTVLNTDASVFDQVGKAGLGDLEISEDGTQLFVVNLGDRKLYQIPIVNPTSATPSAGTPTGYSLPTVTQATGSVFRPFALKYYRGLVYVGGVTTNEAVSTTVNSGTGSTGGTTSLITRDRTGMKAVVFQFDPANPTSGFTEVLTFPLTYTKGATDNDQTGVSRADRWYPWTEVQAATGLIPNRYPRNDASSTVGNFSYPQPMLTGIEFDVDGSMILSIRDRFGDQYGNNNYGMGGSTDLLYRAIAPGDILRAGRCTPGVDLWTIESNASVCSGVATAGANTSQGPGGGEYYYSDAVPVGDNGGTGGAFRPYHLEMSEGGLALLPGRDEVASIVLDPTANIDAGGIRRFKNSDGSGSPSTSVQIYRSTDVASYGKANGLGDLELDCDLPPVQIGNRVWRDVNNNGTQDPGEPGLAGVQVVLRGPGSTTVATATTDANGEYYFSNRVAASTASSIANLTLTSGSSYTVSFPTSVSAFTISAFPNSATGTNGDAIDSDASATGIIALTLGNAGENAFTFDVGYACTPLALSLTSATICAGQTASLTATSGFSSYTFSSGLTQSSPVNIATGVSAGTYSVTATNSSGCSSSATGTITVNPLPVVTLSSATICTGQTASLTATAGYATYIFSAGLTQTSTPNVATATTAGTYSVTAISAAGCIGVSSGAGTITVNTLPSVSLTSATICAGQTATLTATAGLASYRFSAGLTQTGTSNVATGTTAGTYSVTATNTAGCSASATGSLTVNPVPALSLTSATICAGQTASLSAVGTGFATYTFSAGLTQSPSLSVATGTNAGTYSVTATTSAGCSATATGSITVNPLPTVALSSATICAGQTASLTATAGSASYVFSSGLTQVGSTNVATATTAGTYSVTAISSAGCSASATATVTVNPLPVVTLTSATICAGQSTTLTATAGYASYVFPSGLTQIGSTNQAVGSVAGTYSVTAVSSAGCTGVASGTGLGSITANPLPVVTLTSATICAGQTASLTATAGSASYIFSSGLTQVGSTNVATATTAGTYSVTAISSAGCSASATATVTVNPLPVVTLTSATICAGQSTTLTATAGYASYVFPSGLSQIGSTNQAVGSVAGTYSVTAVSSAGCTGVASGTGLGSITVNPLPVVTLTSATICAGQTASLTATAGSASYVFSSGLTQVGSTNVATATTAGTYSVTAISSAGCSASATATVTVNPLPIVTLTSATICAGQSTTLTATAGYASYVFPSGLTQIGSTNQAVGSVAGTYSVTAVSSAGCTGVASGTGLGSITVNPLPTVALASATICAGQTASLTATAGYASYVFSSGLTQVGSTNVATATTAGTYSVTAISSAGCSASATATVVVNPLPTVTLTSATICAGQSTTLTATAGYASYVFPSGLTQIGSTNQAVGSVAGTYSVTAVSSAGCTGVASGTGLGSITVNPLPTVTISVSSATLCQGQSATLTASGGNTYVWSSNQQTASIVVTTGGVYSVTATNTNGCSGVASTTITVNPAPNLTVNSATICAGQSAVLTVSGCDGGTINWSTASTTASIQVLPLLTATYSATCTFATGCSATIATTVTVNPAPSYTTPVQVVAATCTGAVSNNNARINLTTLQNTQRADIVLGSTYGSGPAYGAVTNLTVTAGNVSFTNLPNPGSSQPYTIRLFSAGGSCYTDVTVVLEPTLCDCPEVKCVPVVLRKTAR
ncbi:hypothetical protein GCM10027085_01380 [Spirosoma aerophilum]